MTHDSRLTMRWYLCARARARYFVVRESTDKYTCKHELYIKFECAWAHMHSHQKSRTNRFVDGQTALLYGWHLLCISKWPWRDDALQTFALTFSRVKKPQKSGTLLYLMFCMNNYPWMAAGIIWMLFGTFDTNKKTNKEFTSWDGARCCTMQKDVCYLHAFIVISSWVFGLIKIATDKSICLSERMWNSTGRKQINKWAFALMIMMLLVLQT